MTTKTLAAEVEEARIIVDSAHAVFYGTVNERSLSWALGNMAGLRALSAKVRASGTPAQRRTVARLTKAMAKVVAGINARLARRA